MSGAQITLLVTLMTLSWWAFNPREEPLRGRKLLTHPKRPSTEGRISWGGSVVPRKAETTHFSVIGAPGSGKTLTLKQMMREALPDIDSLPDQRAFVYDAKQDALGFLSSLPLDCPIVTLNPFDARSAAWDMAKDITTPSAAEQLARIIVPDEQGGGNYFFSAGARDLLTELVTTFMRTAPGEWTLRDLVLAGSNKDSLHDVLSCTVSGQAMLASYFSEERTGMNVLATLRTRLAPLDVAASLWAKADYKVSLEEWANGNFVLVVASDERIRASLDTLNRVIFRRLVDITLSQPESFERRSWYFLDEVRDGGKLDGLSSLMTRGRSKGVSVVLGFQDVNGLRHAYGHDLANEIMAMCSNVALLRMASSETAAWASKLMGDYERVEVRLSTSTNGTRRSKTKSEDRRKTEAVLPSEFLTLPLTNAANGLPGFYMSPELGAYRTTTPLADILGNEQGTEPDFIPRPDQDQWLERWSESDFERLGITATAPIDPDLIRPRIHDERESDLSLSR